MEALEMAITKHAETRAVTASLDQKLIEVTLNAVAAKAAELGLHGYEDVIIEEIRGCLDTAPRLVRWKGGLITPKYCESTAYMSAARLLPLQWRRCARRPRQRPRSQPGLPRVVHSI